MVKLNNKIKASTLIETLIAMVILIIVSGIATMTFINIAHSGSNTLRIEAMIQTQNALAETIKNNTFFDEDYSEGSIMIKKRITNYSSGKNLKILEMNAYSLEGRFMYERKEIIRIKEP